MEEEIIDSSFFSEDLEEKSSIDVRKTGFENSFNERQIGSITMAIEPVSSRASIDVVLEMFEQQPDLTAVPIERDDAVVGVVERDVNEKNKASGFKLFASKTCGDYLKESPFTLNCSDFIEKVAAKVNDAAIKAEFKHLIVLLNNRSFYGIVFLSSVFITENLTVFVKLINISLLRSPGSVFIHRANRAHKMNVRIRYSVIAFVGQMKSPVANHSSGNKVFINEATGNFNIFFNCEFIHQCEIKTVGKLGILPLFIFLNGVP